MMYIIMYIMAALWSASLSIDRINYGERSGDIPKWNKCQNILLIVYQSALWPLALAIEIVLLIAILVVHIVLRIIRNK